jgi:hypothetical protein
MLAITVSLGTVATWQAILVVLSIVSTSLNIWRMTKGAKQNDETVLKVKEEIKDDIKSLSADVAQVRADVETTTERLEKRLDLHLDRAVDTEVKAVRTRRKKAAADG